MQPLFYIIVLVVMFAFLLLSKFRWIIVVITIFFVVITLLRFLWWRNQFDYQ